MKTVLMMLAALALAASLSAPGLAQADSIQSRPTTPTSPPPDRGSDTNSPQLPGGSDGDGEPSPGGGGGDGPADGDFEPVEVEFGAQTRTGSDGMQIPRGPSVPGPLIPEIPDEPEPEPEPDPTPDMAGMICCRAFYTGAEWSTREACINGGGDVAPDNLCTPEDGANDGNAVPLRTYEGYELVPPDNGEADTRSGETVDGAPVRRRQDDN